MSVLQLLDLLREAVLATASILAFAPAGNVTPTQAVEYGVCTVAAARRHGIPWQRLAAVVQHESQWRADARSHSNDWGLGQIHCPSKRCAAEPSPAERAALLDGCINLQFAAELLRSKRQACRNDCGDGGYVRLYNPGNPDYLAAILRIERRINHRF